MEGRRHTVPCVPSSYPGPRGHVAVGQAGLGSMLRWCWHLNGALAVLVSAQQGADTSLLTAISHSLLRALPLLFPPPGTFFLTHVTIPSVSA